MKPMQVRWRCRRGVLELDSLLLPFFDKHYLDLSPKNQESFIELLALEDPELQVLFLGDRQTDHPLDALIQSILMVHSSNGT